MKKCMIILALALLGNVWAIGSTQRCMPDLITGLIDIPYTVYRGTIFEEEVDCEAYPFVYWESDSLCTSSCMALILHTEDKEYPLYYYGVKDALKERLDTLHTPIAATIWGRTYTLDFVEVHSISFGFQASTWYGVVKHTPASYTNQSVSFSSVTYRLHGDTVINDTIYQAIWKNDEEYYCGLRTSADGQQVYYRPNKPLIAEPAEPSEYLLYDFSVHVGDTLRAFDSSCPHCCDYEGCDHTFNTKWEVLETSVIEGRKHVRVRGGQSGHTIEWIEGIGTRNIFFEEEKDDLIGGTYTTYALCATDEESVLYSFDTKDVGVINECPKWVFLPIENVEVKKTSTKLIRDGQLLIECNGKTYNAQGVELK